MGLLTTTVIVSSILAFCSGSFSCPGIWQTSLGSSCYKFLGGNLTWAEASLHCREIGGHLAIITSAEENKYLKDFAVRHHVSYPLYRYWLDGKDDESENHWYWDWTGEPIKYTPWQPGEPSNSGQVEHCLGLYGNGNWNDFKCDFKNHAICELEYVDANLL
ncbi:hypothetical protein KUTeg_006573 [Tegillarca granosa]|uniref:C-type lectin domain-containing protein n=1 Tax=Tegillarca granosa TaxID=220873 RepID=A0ABQ9FAQ6_TEGGR|nr:hypothetical protein KUTeg_006573 [Tegillarca granosa]